MFLSFFLIIPVVVLSVYLYLFIQIFQLSLLSIAISLCLTLITLKYIFSIRPVIRFHPHLLIISLCLFVATAIVLSPLVNYQSLRGFTFLTYPSATDFFKHLYAVTSISKTGLPPAHPYFPPGQFSYYFGYYLIPSSLAYIFPNALHWIVYLYVLFTGGVALIFLTELYSRLIHSKIIAALAYLPVIVGLGWDIIPTILDNRSPGGRLLELWSISHGLGLRIDNPFVAYLWTPQHFFSAIIVLLIAYLLLFTRIRNLYLYFFLYLFLFISSIFVFIPAALFTAVFFLYSSTDRKFLFQTGLLTFIMSLPFIFYLSGRGNMFEMFTPGVYPFFGNLILNRVITLFIEYGPLVFFSPVWVLYLTVSHLAGTNGLWSKIKTALLFYCLYLLPILVTWFIRSPNYNDFALRSLLPIQLALPLMAGSLAQRSQKLSKYLLLFLLVITILGSLPGFFYEFIARWKERGLIDVNTSEMLLSVRKLPPQTTLAAIGKAEWIYQIPPFGFRPVLTGNLYDSSYYLGPLPDDWHTKYEIMGQEIFTTQTIDRDLNSVIAQRNSKLLGLNVFFRAFSFDFLITPNSDPWLLIFTSWGAIPKPLTPQYSLIPYSELTSHTLKIASPGNPLAIADRQVQLPAGSWFLVSCNLTGIPYQTLRINDYLVFQGSVSQNGCIGNFYSQKDLSSLQLSADTTITNLTAFPLIHQSIITP